MKRLSSILSIGLLLSIASLAAAHDPRTTAKDFASSLIIEGAGKLTLQYKGMHFNAPAYERMKSDEALRNRLNNAIWGNIGKAELEFDVVIGTEAVSKGSYTLGINIGANDSFSLVLKGANKTFTIPLQSSGDGGGVEYLTFAIYPTGAVDTFTFEARCGKFRTTQSIKVPYLSPDHAHEKK